MTEADMNAANAAMNGNPSATINITEMEMDTNDMCSDERTVSNGTANGNCMNGVDTQSHECEMGE